MAKVLITEGQIPRGFSTNKLKTKLQGSGSCLWVPEDERNTKELNVNSNGTYIAESENYYGYSKIDVKIPGSVLAGYGQDGYKYSIDTDANGNLKQTLVPSRIGYVHSTNTRSFTEGETIDYTGLQVDAFKIYNLIYSDTRYPNGVIPNEELILQEKAEIKDRYESIYTYPRVFSRVFDYSGLNYNGQPFNRHLDYTSSQADAIIMAIHPDNNGYSACIVEGYTYKRYKRMEVEKIGDDFVYWDYLSIDFCVDITSYSDNICVTDVSSDHPSWDIAPLIWMAVYGQPQTIPVQWISPYTFETFETSFILGVKETAA